MQTAREKLRELRALHEDGLLSQQEFDLRRNAILDAEYAPPGGHPGPQRNPSAPIRLRRGTELGLMAGQEIGPHNRRYRLERLIASGGMGQVWQATDLATQAELGHSALVALKVLPPQWTESPAHARLLIEEATQARRLAHEHIVRVYEWAQDPATTSYFIIMECLEGEDLEHLMAREGRMAAGQALSLLAPVANALQYAWDKHRLVHRDIKPANLFLTSTGEVKLLDFGIAARARGLGAAGVAAPGDSGTAGYRAPEAQAGMVEPSPTLDVYAVAVLFYEMLEGELPQAHYPGRPEPGAPAALNSRQWKVLRSALDDDPARRPATACDLLARLQEAGGPTPEEQVAEEAARRRREEERQRLDALQRQQAAEAAAAVRLLAERQRKELEARQNAQEEAARQERKAQ